MIRFSRLLTLAAMMLVLACLFSACGASTDTTSDTGSVDADLTDAPSLDYAHVYVTVTDLAFHLDSGAGSNTAGWKKFTLSAPVTLDLAQLASGKVYSDVAANGKSLFSGIALPVGRYQQIRIYLASTEAAKTASAQALGLSYNNEVQLNNDATHYALSVPTPGEGIRLVPESPVVVKAGGSARLVLDFNLNNDVVAVYPNGTKEYVLKPRLGYFDMNTVGAVAGTVSFGNLSTSRFVIKAEQVVSGKSYRVVRRWTSVDKTTGAFKLYPLPVFGNNTTAVYDILLRARNVQTAIVKKVKVHKGTSLTAGTVNLGTITMNSGREFKAQLAAAMHPSGSWLNFYQTLTTDSVPYEVRYRHLNPYTGMFTDQIELSTAPIQVYDFSTGSLTGPVTDATTTPGAFSAIADAVLYTRGAGVSVTGMAGTSITFTATPPTATPSANSITATVTIPAALMASPPLSKGHLFVTHGGLIIDSYQVDSLIAAGGGSSTVSNLPGGTAGAPLAGAFYGMYIQGWGGGKRASGSQQHIDLTTGNGTAAITMK